MNSVGVVLAGGQSSRMGRDKAFLDWQGRSLLDHALQLLQAAGASQVLVSGRPEHPLGIPDLFPHAGPPAAVYALLHYLQEAGALDARPLLLLPLDMPLMQADTLRLLLDNCASGQALRFAGEVFPCVLPAAPALLAHLREIYGEELERGGARSMKALLAWSQAQELPLDEARRHEFRNANTPEEWQALLAEYGS